MALFERSELVIFREWTSARKVPDSYRAWSRHERFLVSFLSNQKGKSVVNHIMKAIK